MPGRVKSGFCAYNARFPARHEVRRTDGEVCGAARPALRWCAPLLHVTERVRPGSCGVMRGEGAWLCEKWFLGWWRGFFGTARGTPHGR